MPASGQEILVLSFRFRRSIWDQIEHTTEGRYFFRGMAHRRAHPIGWEASSNLAESGSRKILPGPAIVGNPLNLARVGL